MSEPLRVIIEVGKKGRRVVAGTTDWPGPPTERLPSRRASCHDDPPRCAHDLQPHLVSVNARLASAEVGFDVEIRLRQLEGRWLAVADFGGEPVVGIGASPRVALAAALTTLGERTAATLMADPQLFGVSAAILDTA
jgi:hypothetical protein